jgi:hypothetical protein
VSTPSWSQEGVFTFIRLIWSYEYFFLYYIIYLEIPNKFNMTSVKKIKAKTYKKPNLNKPRFRDTKYSKNLISEELYNEWINDNPSFKDRVPTYGIFLKIWNKLASKYRHYTTTNSMGVKLPKFCGHLSLEYINIEYEAIDITKSTETNPVPYLNWNTFEKLGKVVWGVRDAMRFNAYLPFIAFKASSEFRKEATKGLRETPGKYKTAKTINR